MFGRGSLGLSEFFVEGGFTCLGSVRWDNLGKA